MNKKNYKSAIDNIQFSEDLGKNTLDYLSVHSSQPQEKLVTRKVKNKRLYTAFATVVCIAILIIIIPMFKSDFELPNSDGHVSVKYVNKAPSVSSEASLIYLTVEEIFHERNTDIFMGEIVDIKNIKISMNGFIHYRAIAEIRIDKVYRGNITAGEIVSVLMPCPINTNVWVEDSAVVSSMRVGMTGIFMPVKYDENSIWEENGAKICKMDITEYGFFDGMRFAFLDSDKGLIFEKSTYSEISSATSLEEIEKYIIKMIE